MSDVAFSYFTEQVLTLSYEQTILLMSKMLESLSTKKNEIDYSKMETEINSNYMTTVWEELKNDTW